MSVYLFYLQVYFHITYYVITVYYYTIEYLHMWKIDHMVFPPSWKEEFVPLFVNCLDKWRMMRLMMQTVMFYPIFWAELHKNKIGWIIY